MKTIARLAAVAIVVAAAPLGLGCRADPIHRGPRPPTRRRLRHRRTPSSRAGARRAVDRARRARRGCTAVSKDYAGDIAKLCEVVQLSNAAVESPDDRRLPIATWLAANLTTTESRQFLAQIQPLVGNQKADALDAEARRVGLPSCSLSAEWRAQ